MSRGGARNRTGRNQPDPKSERSERLGVRFGQLPREGYTGRPPAWPFTTPATTRERRTWVQVWKLPQAAAWATEPWRHRAVAMYCRLMVRCEEPDSVATLHGQLIRYADQIGLTPAGLRENNWEIEESPRHPAAEKVGQGAPTPPAARAADGVPSARDRLSVVG
jgi:hypothetical protein